MIQHKSYKYRIYPTYEQQIQIEKTFGASRFVYNQFLERKMKAYKRRGETLSKFECMRYLTGMKTYRAWLNDIDNNALRFGIKNMDAAYKAFFRGCKTGEDIGYPKFKSKGCSRQSFTTDGLIRIRENGIQLPKLGVIKYSKNRELEGRILQATVSKSPAGKYYISICCEVDIEYLPVSPNVIGLDVGIKSFVVDSNGNTYENPNFFKKSEKKLAKAQRALSKKEKWSNNYIKQKYKVARMYEKISNQRTTHHHQLSSKLVKENQLIVVEQLAVKNMVRNHNLSKSISDVAWGEFYTQLEYKSKWAGREFVKIDRFYPSSQTCHCCGYINKKVKDLKVRTWTCPKCGVTHDRDVNAAVNILNEGLCLSKQKAA